MVEIELNREGESIKRTREPNLFKSFGSKAYALLHRTIILHKAEQSKNFNKHEFLNITGTIANDCSKVIYPESYKIRNHVLYVYKMHEKELQWCYNKLSNTTDTEDVLWCFAILPLKKGTQLKKGIDVPNC